MNYENKQESYYNNIRHDLINFIGKINKNAKFLEIGAAYGATLHFLKENAIASEVVGVELFQDNENLNRYKPLDDFYFGDVETINLDKYQNYFDFIILADVLEHITEPKNVLEKIKNVLNNNGEVIISMPNVRHYSSFIKIFIKGNFKYEESGIFDYTHARFYCKSDMISLFEKSGYNVIKSEGSIRRYKGKSLAKIINTITFGVFEEFFSVQFYFKIRKKE